VIVFCVVMFCVIVFCVVMFCVIVFCVVMFCMIVSCVIVSASHMVILVFVKVSSVSVMREVHIGSFRRVKETMTGLSFVGLSFGLVFFAFSFLFFLSKFLLRGLGNLLHEFCDEFREGIRLVLLNEMFAVEHVCMLQFKVSFDVLSLMFRQSDDVVVDPN